jgi:hypothetical protein
MTEIHPYFVTFMGHSITMTHKSVSSDQISTHFRLKTKSQEEFIYKIDSIFT